MKRIVCSIAVLMLVMALFSTTALAEIKPIQLSIWETVQLYDKSTSISGLRLSIYGVNEDVKGIDFGLVTKVNGEFLGWQSGIVNLVEGNATGYQDGVFNRVRGDFLGWQTGWVNITESKFTGLQTGLVNMVGDMHGVQFSVVNVADTLYGLQIGIINLNNSGNPFKFLPLVNFSF